MQHPHFDHGIAYCIGPVNLANLSVNSTCFHAVHSDDHISILAYSEKSHARMYLACSGMLDEIVLNILFSQKMLGIRQRSKNAFLHLPMTQ